MKKEYKRLPEAELDIMNVIWEKGEPMNSVQIQECLQGKRDWNVVTILNLLARLVERGFVSTEKQGKYKIYSAIVNREEYLQKESRTILDHVFGGSVSRLISALYDGESLTQEDIISLKAFIDEKVDEENR